MNIAWKPWTWNVKDFVQIILKQRALIILVLWNDITFIIHVLSEIWKPKKFLTIIPVFSESMSQIFVDWFNLEFFSEVFYL